MTGRDNIFATSAANSGGSSPLSCIAPRPTSAAMEAMAPAEALTNTPTTRGPVTALATSRACSGLIWR